MHRDTKDAVGAVSELLPVHTAVRVGQLVMLHSLVRRPELNGLQGLVITAATGNPARVGVRVSGFDEPLTLQMHNLAPLYSRMDVPAVLYRQAGAGPSVGWDTSGARTRWDRRGCVGEVDPDTVSSLDDRSFGQGSSAWDTDDGEFGSCCICGVVAEEGMCLQCAHKIELESTAACL